MGAGISKDAGLPLMAALTVRVFEMSEAKPHIKVLESLRAELPANAHIEHLLSHLGDYTTLAQRNATKRVNINGETFEVAALEDAHKLIASDIAFTIRWGYKVEKGAGAKVGSSENPIVTAEHHQRFVHALFGKRQAGIAERRKPVPLFTTNYDTLLEDALALGQYTYWDGFSGGAVAFRTHRFGQREPESGCRAAVIKTARID